MRRVRRARCFLSFFFLSLFLETGWRNDYEKKFVMQNWKRCNKARISNSSRAHSLEDVENGSSKRQDRESSPKIAFAISPVKELACIRKAKPEPVIRRRGRSGSRKRKLVKFR